MMSDKPHIFQIREGRLNNRGLTLCYREWLHPAHKVNSPVTIALHGWMDNAGTFDVLIPELDLTRVIALDFSGHGLSDHRSADAEYYLWDYIQEVLALQEHLELESCHLLSHSMGAAVAGIYSAVFPEKVNSLIVLDMAGPIATQEDRLVEQMRESVLGRKGIDGQPVRHYSSFEAACESRAQRGISLQAATVLARRGVQQDEEGWFWCVDRQLTRKLPVSLSESQSQAVLKEIACPCLTITAQSVWSHRPDFLQNRLACIRNLQHVSLSGSHFQHLEGDTTSVSQAINGFYGSLE